MKTVEEIQSFIHAFEMTTLTSLEIEMDGIKLKMTKAGPQPKGSDLPTKKDQESQDKNSGFVVKSPLVGTFFSSPSPEATPFVKAGDHVAKGTTLCIIEAMKTMNEIKAPVAGKIKTILVKSGEYVGFDQSLMTIEHDA